MSNFLGTRIALGAGAAAALWAPPLAAHADAGGDDAEKTVAWTISYTADVSGAVSGGLQRAGRFLDDLHMSADVSLERLWGLPRTHVFADVLSNSGGAPNDVAGTLQGVDNIEVARPRAKIYQFWVEHAFMGDRASALAGFYDLNSEFYQTDAAGMLIGPAFGIGSELAATGPNGPSIFPSTALALRLRWSPLAGQNLQVAALNASAGVVGDPGGADYSFDDGALLIAEWSTRGALKLRAGAWRYTDKQDDIRDVDALGAPASRRAQGAYLSIEGPLMRSSGRDLIGFARLGAADGDTSPYLGGWQAGATLSPVFAGRPESALAFGFNQGLLNAKQRANMRDDGLAPAPAESAFEITYSDTLIDHVTLQPDLQLIHNPNADHARDDALVATLRVSIAY